MPSKTFAPPRSALRHWSLPALALLTVATCVPRIAQAQGQTGLNQFQSASGTSADAVNLGDLDDHTAITLLSRPGRGVPFTFKLSYDNILWQPQSSSGNVYWAGAGGSWGWRGLSTGDTFGKTTFQTQQASCTGQAPSGMYFTEYFPEYTNWKVIDPSGTPHPISLTTYGTYPQNCISGSQAQYPENGTGVATDGSGITLVVTGSTNVYSITSKKGLTYTPGSTTITDPNGNEITSSTATGGNVTWSSSEYYCTEYSPGGYPYQVGYYEYYNWTYKDPQGGSHSFPLTTYSASPCNSYPTSGSAAASDGSGYEISVSSGDQATVYLGSAEVWNYQTGGSTETTFVDTLGQKINAVYGTGNQLLSLSYPAPGGATASANVIYSTVYVSTSFGCSNIGEWGPNPVVLPTEVDLPDGSKYKIGYAADGTMSTLTTPQGGVVALSGLQINCNDGTWMSLTRKTSDPSDSSDSGTWTYSRANNGNGTYTTAISTPAGDNTHITFASSSYGGGYEIERTTQDSSGKLWRTVDTCYNGATNCGSQTNVSMPIGEIASFTHLDDGQTSEVDEHFDNYGDITEKDEYGYGANSPGALVRKTLTWYAYPGKPSEVQVQDPSGNVQAETDYKYDQYPVVSTTGLPNHVAGINSRNLTTESEVVGGGAAPLVKQFTYWDTGLVDTVSDGLHTQMTTSYDGTCGIFPTVTYPTNGATVSEQGDCAGGVETSKTDMNGNTSSVSYSGEPLWRPYSTTDPDGNTTYYVYTPTTEETALSFGSSKIEVETTFDGFGHPWLKQRLNPDQSNWNSTETDYDALGRAIRTSAPYVAGIGVAATTANGSYNNFSRTNFDALGRPTSIIPAGASVPVTEYSYLGAATLVQTENGNTDASWRYKQVNRDGLGRLTSVCEGSTSGQAGDGQDAAECGMITATNSYGFVTRYQYNQLDKLTSVWQNALSATPQSRTMSYDEAGRMTAETNPENGTTRYVYDNIQANNCAEASPGDLVERSDNEQNITCYLYDAMHRLIQKTHTTVEGTAFTPNEVFVYDSATVDGAGVGNAKGRLAEAYTVDSNGNKLTDDGFSYGKDGRVTKTFQWTQHSEGWYAVSASYYANGTVDQLSGIDGVGSGTVTYGLDSEGRPYSMSDGTTRVSSTSYNVFGEATGVYFANGDSDGYSYDANTGRMIGYSFGLEGVGQIIANLGWNADGSVQSLSSSDTLGSGGQNSFNCTFAYDELGRLHDSNCGTNWNQSFSFDPFGNITKNGIAGAGSFVPNYNESTNQIASVGDANASYDADGELTYDPTGFSYSWDAAGQAVSISDSNGTSNVRYDALGRQSEIQDPSGVWHWVIYGPTGRVAILKENGSDPLEQATIALPGGATAVYNSGGFDFFRHGDNLGSGRLGSFWDHTIAFDQFLAPYGEQGQSWSSSGVSDREWAGITDQVTPDLYDALFREYNSLQGRWISPDPAGFGAVDLADPQSWNRYAYVENTPADLIDPSGEILALPAAEAGTAVCGPVCGAAASAAVAFVWFFRNWLFGASHVHVNIATVKAGKLWPEWGTWNGLPSGASIPSPWGINGNPNCDFGPCWDLGSVGSGFAHGGAVVAGVAFGIGTAACEIAEPCGAFEDVSLIVAGVSQLFVHDKLSGAQVNQMSKGGNQNVGHEHLWLAALAASPKDPCGWLKAMMNETRGRSGDFLKFKRTYKYYCRGK